MDRTKTHGTSDEAIEITPEMIEAGIDAICKIDWRFETYEEAALSIYKAMRLASAGRHRLLSLEIECDIDGARDL
jgi:hypothetical protein